ncbi:hypothetical protein BKA62DRAFT_709222 [Auriculariales sp. MPI-PUGE-AT-0066]|nr:hypothetical protein BKA62DRAFT_709222 [Auriculariales sp. MPI-PUGE-AT-0066]
MDSWKRRTRRALLVSLLLSPSSVLSFWPFTAKRFTQSGLIDAGALGIADEGRIVAFGDFNADQLKGATITHPATILNVVPGDMTYDGKLDLLVMSEGDNQQISMTVYLGPFQADSQPQRLDVPDSTLAQPIPLDANGDMKIDLLGEVNSGGRSTIKLWQNSWSGPGSNLFTVADPVLRGATCPLANPHSNAVVDLNGDCLADLFLVCEEPASGERSYQIWVNSKDSGFSLVGSGPLPDGIGAISFADMNRDGTIDIVFPTCDSVSSSGVGSKCKINIAFNQQLPLCITTSQKNCRSPESLCVADNAFTFNLDPSPSNAAFVSIPLGDILDTDALLMQDDTFKPYLPVALRIGDLNLDGFPDIIAIAVEKDGSRVPKVLLSNGGRKFQLVKDDVEALEAIKDARGVTVVDLDEDGSLDILVQRSGKDAITFIQNNFFYDAFWLRAIGRALLISALLRLTFMAKPFGVSYSGATYKYTVLDTTGARSAAQVGQLPQTAYHSLNTPYAFFGLGRTNNYIENLFVGSTKHAGDHYINIEGNWIPWVGVSVVAAMLVLAVMTFVLHLNEKREDELERRRASHHINFDAL